VAEERHGKPAAGTGRALLAFAGMFLIFFLPLAWTHLTETR
jgi:hypothetical protein